jgi:hypothetical protein
MVSSHPPDYFVADAISGSLMGRVILERFRTGDRERTCSENPAAVADL